MREICTSGSVRGEGGNILAYSAVGCAGRRNPRGIAGRRNKAIAPYGTPPARDIVAR
jgi:hypothetical protein